MAQHSLCCWLTYTSSALLLKVRDQHVFSVKGNMQQDLTVSSWLMFLIHDCVSIEAPSLTPTVCMLQILNL